MVNQFIDFGPQWKDTKMSIESTRKKNRREHGPYRNEIEEKLQIATQYAHKEVRCSQIQDKFKAENDTHGADSKIWRFYV